MSLLTRIYLLAVSAAIILYMASLALSVFGPTRGQSWLMAPALLTTLGVFLVVSFQWQKGTLQRAGVAAMRAYRGRRIFAGLAFLCFAGALASLLIAAVASTGGGAPHGDGPLLADRAEYRLVNHGEFIDVSRTRYIVVGLSSLLGWHCLGLTVAFVCLHLLLFGCLPTQCPSD